MKYLLLIFMFFICFCSEGQNSYHQLVEKGYNSYLNREYVQAVNLFNEAEKLDKSDAELYYLRGACLSVMGDNEKAMVDLDRATTLFPEYAEAWYEKGYILFLQNHPQKAIDNFTTAIRYKPDYAEAYLNRGTVRCMVNDTSGAKEDYKKAEELGITVSFTCD